MQFEDISIGADVEVFVKHRKTGEVVSAEGFIQGTKEVPFNFDPVNPYYATSLDNVLAEFCIPPASTKQEFYNSIRKSLGYINKTIPKDYCTAILQAHSLDSKWLQTKHAQTFGCEPDYDAYYNGMNIKPYCADVNLRTAGGHLHIGYKNAIPYVFDTEADKYIYKADQPRLDLIKALDLHIGVPSILMEPENTRKQLYGKAGCFRPKPYGVEYRTVSNFYLLTPKLTKWAYDAAITAVNWLNAGNAVEAGLQEHVQRIINNNNRGAAQELIEIFHLKVA